MASTVYPYAVTIHCQGENHVERVNAFTALDAYQCAILQFMSNRNIAGKSADGATVIRVEPDFTMVARPTMDASMVDAIITDRKGKA